MIKTTKILTMMLVLMMGMSFASCDEFLGQADNPVTPAKTTITISSFKIVGTRTVSPGDVLVFGIDEKAQCVVTVDKKEYTLTGTVEDIPADLKPYIVTEWTSSDAQVATVDGKGTVTALAVGKTTIKLTVSAKDGSRQRSASYTLYVKDPDDIPEGWTVTVSGYSGTYDGKAHGITATAPEDATVKYGTVEGTYTLTASPTYTDAGTYTVYYKVTMENYDPVTGSAEVKIAKAAGTIKFTQTSIEKNYGDVAFKNDTFSIIGDGVVTYTSSDTSVASVSNVSPNNGQVSILGTGTATITATVADSENYTYAKKTAEYTVTVKPTSGTQDYNNGGTQTW